MAKKNTQNQKPSGAAAIKTVDDLDQNDAEMKHESNGSEPETAAALKRTPKAKADQASEGNFGVSEIKKAAAFVNSVGGLDKAVTLLQILKVAKEVQ